MAKVVLALYLVIPLAPPIPVDNPQCWDRYSQRHNLDCVETTPGTFPGAGGGGPPGDGGLIGAIRDAIGGIL